MKSKSTKQLIFLGVLAAFMLWGAVLLTPALADSRPDFVVAVQKNHAYPDVAHSSVGFYFPALRIFSRPFV